MPKAREEAFPRLWEENPVGLLHLLSESNCLPVHEFAVKALRDCREFVEKFDAQVILMLLSRPFEITAKFGFEMAKKLYDPANPNVELAVAVAISDDSEARAEGFRWIDGRRELFAKDVSVLLKLFTSKHADARKFAANLMQATIYSETEAKNLIAVLIAEMILFDEEKREIAINLSDALLKSFGRELHTLNFETIKGLLTHSLVEVQQFGGNVLLGHEIEAKNLPDELINSLIESEFEQIRNIGIKLFGKLPDENLLKRESLIVALLSHELFDVFNSTRPIALRLVSGNEKFYK